MSRALPCPFFKTWTAEMAYVLGYWFADGNMYFQPGAGGYFISIGSKDVEHLATLREVIGAGNLARITGSDVYKLVICRKEMYTDLLRLGGTERKSLTLTWPDVPEAFLADFVRGYVDGDGSLTWNKPNNSVLPMITAAGTQEFLTGMSAAIASVTGIPAPTCHRDKRKHVSSIAWFGIFAKCLAYWLYHRKPGLSLPRKRAIAEQFLAWQPLVQHPGNPCLVAVGSWQLAARHILPTAGCRLLAEPRTNFRKHVLVFYASRVTPKMWELFPGHLP
jgi:hypothetical protein